MAGRRRWPTGRRRLSPSIILKLVTSLVAVTGLELDVDPTCGGASVEELSLKSVAENNLGGGGPNDEDLRKLRFSHVATVDGQCITLDFQVARGSQYTSPESGSENGVSSIGENVGVINLNAKSRVDLEAWFLECNTKRPARLSKFNLTFFQVNAPSSRKITVRGYWAYYLNNNDLFQKTYTDYGTTFIDSVPCSSALGSSSCALTYSFQDTNVVSLTFETKGPTEPFFFSGSMCKSLRISSSGCSAISCGRGYRLRSPNSTCASSVCTNDECCERSYDLCTKDVCGFGYELKGASALPPHCRGQVCTREECCMAVDTGGTARIDIAVAPAVASCKGHERQWHACEGLPECHPCEPKDCRFEDWSEWSGVGGCTGLCKRNRKVSENNECGRPCHGHTEETESRLDDPACYPESCKVKNMDCKWAEWSDWTECQEGCTTCMLGQSFRKRRIIVKQLGHGKACDGSWNMTRPCQLSDALDCKMTDWNAWSECSKPCGTGWKFRMRRVLRQAKWEGQPCGADGDYGEGLAMKQTHACNVQACSDPEPCVLDTWTDWSGCNQQDRYQKFRSREILMPAMGDERHCYHPLNETHGCPPKPKKVPTPCQFSDWSDWSSCTATCEGQHVRTRHVTNNGATCVLAGGGKTLRETKPCGADLCWQDTCGLSEWSGWSPCSSDCGVGVMSRYRQIMTLGHLKGCTAGLSEVKACNIKDCAKVDCAWGGWDNWSGCTNSCGGGTKRRSRMIKVTPRNGGDLCDPESKAEVAPCNTQRCDTCIDGEWASWSGWSNCSSTCAPAYHMRHRDAAKHANACGKPALGDQEEYEMCAGLHPCESDRDCEVADWGDWSACTSKCFGVREQIRQVTKYATGAGKKCEALSLKDVKPCNPGEEDEAAPEGCGPDPERACRIGIWEEWSKCSKSCDGGQKTRQRHILSPAANDGEPCEDVLEQTVPCNDRSCVEDECKDCVWGPWSVWGDCTKCGFQRFRHRSIETMPNHCRKHCDPGAAKETDKCHSDCEEKFFCAWSDWETMGECSASCGLASRMRQRQLSLSKTDQGEGNFFIVGANIPCNGNQVDVVTCSIKPCEAECTALDCAFETWEEWGPCSCNQLKERRRSIGRVASCGGLTCEGPLVQTERCEKECSKPVDCELGSWEEWSPVICALPGDPRVRIRAVLQEPENGGAACAGIINETSRCEDHTRTPVNCEIRHWQEWSDCSAKCGGGLKVRARSIASMPDFGGATCDGDLEMVDQCNTKTCETEDVDCELSDWAEWSSCVGMAMRFRIRRIDTNLVGLGEPCHGSLKEAEACNNVVDCEVSDWSGWDECDKSCGGGQKTRAREVTTNPRNGGKQCPQRLIETRGCNEDPCESQDCTVSEWGGWNDCSVNCGQGTKTRKRTFESRPCEDGRGCDLDLEEVKPCHQPACECKDCRWTNWTDWSRCSEPCDGGQRSRDRHILQAPEPGCKPCDAKTKQQVEGCNTHRCHEKVCQDGEWDEWGKWEACSSTCKGGVTWRTRSNKIEANDCGRPAVGLSMEQRPCNTEILCTPTVDCEFDDWIVWSACSSRCAGLTRRHRNIKTHGQGAGKFCTGPMEQNKPCEIDSGIQDWVEPTMYLDLTNLRSGAEVGGGSHLDRTGALLRFQQVACESGYDITCKGKTVDLVVKPKSSYTGCDMHGNGRHGVNFGAVNVASGTNVVLEFRLVDSISGDDVPSKELMLKIFDLDAGLNGASRESVHARGFQKYFTSKSSSIKVEQELSNLTRFSASRYGTADDNPSDPTEVTPIQEDKSVVLYYEGASTVEVSFEVGAGQFCKTFLFAVRACFSGNCQANPCNTNKHEPVDCKLNEWEDWGQCDATCGQGQRIRTRQVLGEPAYGGAPCSNVLTETASCFVKPCQDCALIDCAWEEWGDWSHCDKCDGEMRRYRHIASHPSCGGKACDAGSAVDISNCTRSCLARSYCEWSEWHSFGTCSSTCGTGLKSRMRYLKVYSSPPQHAEETRELLLTEGALSLDALEINQKFEQLQARSQTLRSSRWQALALAFISGGLVLAAVLGFASRGCSLRGSFGSCKE